jgi:uncharacterized damage-inducible protein DinB
MKWQQLITDLFRQITKDLEEAVAGLSVEELNRQPAPDCNSIGWLGWHLTRSIDRNMSELMGEEQLWIKDGWHAKFNRAPDPGETGAGHTTEQAREFQSPPGEVLMEYHHALLKKVENYLNTRLSEKDLDREVYSPTFKNVNTVHNRLVGVIRHQLYHAGQAAYVRGLLQGKGWYGR